MNHFYKIIAIIATLVLAGAFAVAIDKNALTNLVQPSIMVLQSKNRGKTLNLVTVIGGTKKQREFTEKVVWYCIKELMPRHRTLEIEVQLTKCLDKGAYGYCVADEGTNRSFIIEVDKSLSKFKDK